MSSSTVECNGRGDGGNHCCYLEGEVCRFLTHAGDLPRCALRLELGSWDAVHADPRYLEQIRPVLDRYGISDCGVYGTGRDGKRRECCFKTGDTCPS